MKSQKSQSEDESNASCCLYFSNAAKSILKAPILLANYIVANPGKAILSLLALQSQSQSILAKETHSLAIPKYPEWKLPKPAICRWTCNPEPIPTPMPRWPVECLPSLRPSTPTTIRKRK